MSWHFQKFRHQEFTGLIRELIFLYSPDTYVEIGVQKGYNFNQVLHLVKRAVAVDVAPMPMIYTTNNVETYQMDSVAFARQWTDPIDLLFIDADHRKDSVLRDFDNLSPFVTPGSGLILLHDTYPSAEYLLADGYSSNAWEAAREIHLNPKYSDFEIVTLPGPYAGLSIIRKAEQHLHWRDI